MKDERINSLSFSPDGNKFAILSSDLVEVCELVTGRLFFAPLSRQFKVSAAVFSPDSKRLVTCTSDSAIGSRYAQMWNAITGQPLGEKMWHRDGVTAAAWSNDGDRLLAVSEQGIGQIRFVPSGEPIGREIRHREQISHVVLRQTPDLALTASRDNTATLWDAKTGDAVSPPYRFPDSVKKVWFCPELTQFVVQESGGPVWVQAIAAMDWPLSILQDVADLLAGRSALFGQVNDSKGARALAARWEDLRSAYPEFFSVSNEEVLHWRRAESERYRQAKQHRFEFFQLKEILRISPPIPTRSSERTDWKRFCHWRRRRIESNMADRAKS